jgi:uncharacterized membrane protein YfcA
MTAESPSSLRRYAALIVVGIVGGVLSGAFGVGGGIIMVPLLIWLAGFDQRRAAATSLVAIVPTAIAGTVSYLAQGEVHIAAGLLVAAGGIGGSIVGTRLLKRLPISWLRWLFIALLLFVVVRTLLEPPTRGADFELSGWSGVGLVVLGIVMGIASGLFGIGGGIVAVPVFIALFGMNDLLAKGTSLLTMIPTAITGSVANMRAGMVRLVDGVVVGVFATASSFLGVALAFWIDPRWGSVAFAALMLLASAQLAVRAVRAGRSGR